MPEDSGSRYKPSFLSENSKSLRFRAKILIELSKKTIGGIKVKLVAIDIEINPTSA